MKNEFNDPKKQYPKGYFLGIWMAIGMAIFSGIGVPISIATDNYALISIGPALGIAFGLSIGQIIEKKHEKEGRIRPKTEKEKKRKYFGLILGIVMLILGLVYFLTLYF